MRLHRRDCLESNARCTHLLLLGGSHWKLRAHGRRPGTAKTQLNVGALEIEHVSPR